MKRILKFVTLLLAFVMVFSFAACGETPPPQQEEVQAESITLSGMKTQFANGEPFSSEGLSVTVLYSDETTRTASPLEYTVDSSAYRAETAGSYEIKVTLGSLSEKYSVTVAEKSEEVTVLSLVLSGMKTSFELNEAFSSDGLVVTAHLSDGTDKVLTSEEYEIDSSAYQADTAGQYQIKVSCGEVNQSYTVTVAASQTAKGHWADDGVLKILLISNSYGDDTINYMWQIADSMGVKAVLGQLYIGGCSVRMHAENAASDAPVYTFRTNVSGTWNHKFDAKMSEGLSYQDDWDYIGLSYGSGADGTEPRGPEAYERLPELIAHVRKFSDAEIMWNMTWSDAAYSNGHSFVYYGRDQMAHYNALKSETQTEVMAKYGINLIVATGTAIQNARTSFLGDTLNRDGSHLTLGVGRYIAGLTMFSVCTGMSVKGIEYCPAGDYPVSAREKLVAIESAENAVKSPFEVTPSKYH